MGEGSGEGAMPPPQNFFLIFRTRMLHFEANFRQLTRPVAINLKPAKSCDRTVLHVGALFLKDYECPVSNTVL